MTTSSGCSWVVCCRPVARRKALGLMSATLLPVSGGAVRLVPGFVIRSSPGDLEPVFQTMLASTTHICEAKFGNLFLREGDTFRAVAMHGAPTYVEWSQREPVRPWERPSALT